MPDEQFMIRLDPDTVDRLAEDLLEGESVVDRVEALVEREYGDRDESAVEFVDDCAL